jgi:hypothetical protein
MLAIYYGVLKRDMPQIILCFVYGLTDPRLKGDLAVRYIGVTTEPNKRYQAHLNCPQFDPLEKNDWVKDVYAAGFEPGIDIFEIYKAPGSGWKAVRSLAEKREEYWIQHYEALGANLLNSQNIGKVSASEVELSAEFPEISGGDWVWG